MFNLTFKSRLQRGKSLRKFNKFSKLGYFIFETGTLSPALDIIRTYLMKYMNAY